MLSNLPVAKNQIRTNFYAKNCNFGLNDNICLHITNIYNSNIFMENCVFLKNKMAAIQCEFVNKLSIMNTEIGDNKSAGVVSENSVLHINNSSINGNAVGLLIKNNKNLLSPNISSVIIDYTKFCNNFKTGIEYTGHSCQSINMTNVKVMKNCVGVQISESEDSKDNSAIKINTNAKNGDTDSAHKIHSFKLKDSEVCDNHHDGVCLKNITTQLMIFNTMIQKNGGFAIYVEKSNQIKNVV